jgi:predicted DNA-binding transcriptional regulator AlpA
MSTSQNPGCIAGKQRFQAAFTDLRLALPELPEESLPDFLGNLARLEAEARIRLNVPRQASGSAVEDRLLDVKGAAERLGVSTSQMYRTADDFPFTIRTGRTLRFSSLGISRWIERKAR